MHPGTSTYNRQQLMRTRLAIMFGAYLQRMEKMRPPTSRQAAYATLKSEWRAILLEFGAPRDTLSAFDARTMTAEDGWRGLENDPCYWENRDAEKIRVYLYHNGTIVMQRKNSANPQILFSKIGGVLPKSSIRTADPL